jgi:ribose/xylose/arabinose/galactoside ABC-type transport system permease subunit
MTSQEILITDGRSKWKARVIGTFKGSSGSNLTLLITLLVMLMIFSVLSPHFFQVNNLLNIARSISITGVVAIGMTLVLISGGIDLSVSAVMALAGMVAVVGVRSGLPFAVGFLIAIAVGSMIGLINGLIVTKIRINPLITTLGMGMVVRGFAYIGSGGNTLTVTVPGFTELGRGRLLDTVPYPVIILVITYIVAYILLTRTLAGRYIYAIGGNPIACRLAGIDVDRWRVLFYAICGLCAGFAGYMLSSLTGAAMGNAALGAELDIIAGVILGGASLAGGEGTIIGTLLGILLLGTLTNGLIMLNVPSFWQMVARGTVLMLALFIDSWRSGGYR